MTALHPSFLSPRQSLPPGYVVGPNGRIYSWWYTTTGQIVKWSLFLGMLFFITLYLSVGYFHAKKRIRKGLAPLRYHRWMITRAELARVDPRYAFPQHPTYTQYNYGNGAGGAPGNMAPPPPMYDPNAQRPPVYEPPAGATKMDPMQGVAGGDFAPPPGPPPPARS